MIDAAMQKGMSYDSKGLSYDEYYSRQGDELEKVLRGAGVSWSKVADVAGNIADASAVAGLGTAATGIGAAATPLLEGIAAGAKGVEFVASMLGSGTELDDALRDLYASAQHIAKRQRLSPSETAKAVRNLRGAPLVRDAARDGLVDATQLADSRHVAALEHTLLAQRKLPRRRAGKAKAVPAQRKASRSQLKYHRGTRHKR